MRLLNDFKKLKDSKCDINQIKTLEKIKLTIKTKYLHLYLK